ncbi:hypothetical protein FACS189427_13720 [Planctomycetales bacterium]|nr:hypothetical protein FACS189427_13720 [Planctomycetales bacterium]
MSDFSVLSFLDEAKHLAELGYAVFQCIPKTKIPFAKTAPEGCNSAITDLDTIEEWWTKHPNCNIGIKCENILVIDPDCKDGYDGARDLANIVNSVGKLPDSPLVRTGSGGWHLFFARPKKVPC